MIQRAFSRIRRAVLALHRDDQGADILEYILIVAAVTLPLLAVVIWFWKDIKDWAISLWEKNKSDAQSGMP